MSSNPNPNPNPISNSSLFRRGAPLPRPVLNIAHRGAASLAPENTLAAARKAYELNADLWECDVRFTKDGVPILMHDLTLRRTTNVYRKFPTRAPWWVKSFTLEEIKRLDAGSWFNQIDPFGQIRAGAVSPEEREGYRGEPVPTLEEALRFTAEHGWRVNIEIKGAGHLPPRRLARAVLEVLERLGSGLKERVLISSYDRRVLREIKRIKPEVPLAAVAFFRPADPQGYLERLQVDAYHPGPLALDLRALPKLRELGFRVNVWTYDAPDRLRELASVGVTGIFTNFPQRLGPILEELFGPNPAEERASVARSQAQVQAQA